VSIFSSYKVEASNVLTPLQSLASYYRGVQASDLQVVVGQYDMNSVDEKEEKFQIDRIWLHKDFQTEGPYSHDLALVRLRRKRDGSAVR